MRRLALTTLLSNKLRENQLVVVDNLELDQPKTKEMIGVLAALGVGPSVLLVADGADKATLRSARNIPRVKMLPASLLNTLDLLNHRMVLMTLDAVKKADELWSVAYIRPKRRKSSKDAEG
jgi:large subunit ribosomal protein L4